MDIQDNQSQQEIVLSANSRSSHEGDRVHETLLMYRRSLSDKTRRRHDDEQKILKEYLQDCRLSVDDLANKLSTWAMFSEDLVKRYITWLSEKGYAPKSIKTHLYTIKAYCRLAKEAKLIAEDEYNRISSLVFSYNQHAPRIEQKTQPKRLSAKKLEPLHISEEQAVALLRQPDTAQGSRDQLLLCLLMKQGLWPKEIATLSAGALHLERETLTFYRPLAQEKQEHLLVFETVEAAKRYFKHCSPITTLLMGSRKGGNLTGEITDRAINDRVRFLGAKVGLQKLSPRDCHNYWVTSQPRPLAVEEWIEPLLLTLPPQSLRVKVQSDIFNRQAFETSLHQLGVPEPFIPSVTHEFRLLIPLLLQALGEKQLLAIVVQRAVELGLNPQPNLWQEVIKYLVNWAKDEIRLYGTER